jgi:aerobic-type carbon monoxide dehydrogenase small subunit (CoxS/CutS family)
VSGKVIQFKVNGESRKFEGDPRTPLLWVLRETLKLTGTKFGCGIARCGVCTVHLDGLAIRSCVKQIADVEGREITTIEGISHGDELDPVQQAWLEMNVPQCGYCQPGQIMAAKALLKAKPNPTDEDIDIAMAGNLCRCGTYPRIRAAIHRLAGR